VWEKSHQLTLDIYKATETFPHEERYGITSQIRRASVSIPTNIAEGSGRQSDADFGRFLGIAMGSASELEYLILLAKDLELLGLSDHIQLHTRLEEIKKMLAKFIIKLRADR
jgi:four helix bundle protein